MALTKEQLLVKDTRGKNMLVSAAAGSGKTFVLVERIISEILDEKNGIDVDEILVVTFTTAAAAEMKDRIRRAIDKAIANNGADARIRAQATLIHNAHIRTIDSFCSWVVKNYFYEIDMDPAFRIGTSGELKMLCDEVFSDLLSKYLEADDEDFKLLADAYISGRRTDTLKEMVFAIHDKATSFAWVDEWYDNALNLYNIGSVEELENSQLVKQIIAYTDLYVSGLIDSVAKLLDLYDSDCDSKDKHIFSKELAQLRGIAEATTFKDKYSAVMGADFSERFGSKGTSLNEDDLARAKALRAKYKDVVGKLKESYYSSSLEDMFSDLMYVKKQASALIRFTKEYTKSLNKIKAKKNIYDFNDIEHMALEILRNKDSKEHEKRSVAVELSQHFKEVMVDEYQDSNELQEQILTAISNGSNYFTVGDVKQSIYAFRQASPQLFIDKLYTYPTDDTGNDIRIDLDNNFRSRWQVLDFCNQVFEPLMQMDVGGVAYDEKAALKLGDKSFPGEAKDYESEIIIATQNSDSMQELNIENGDELEALVVAKRIKELMASGFQVSGKNDEGRYLRDMRLSDVVILMRGTKGHADKYISTLKDYGIPAYVAEETGFFDREEIETVLSMLTIIDNPFNDIPLAAVLHSQMFGFSSERLAQIRTINTEESLYGCLLEWDKTKSTKDVSEFLDTLNYFREQAIDTPIHEIIENILEYTKYGMYCKALPNGKMASANLDKLVDEAVNFESTSFKGLSRFVSYIESLRTYDEDLGLAKTVGENDEAVKIMTIHKSKGLEFPVVFVCGCGRGFRSDTSNFSYDATLGVALNYRNPETRITYKTPFFNLIHAKAAAEERGEYLRILYVAFTRAVDKLIITGAIKPSKDKSVVDKLEEFSGDGSKLSFPTKIGVSTSIELIIRALNASGRDYNRRIIDCQELFIDQVEKGIVKEQVKKAIESIVQSGSTADNTIANTLSFKYNGLADSKYKSKYSVSEIKHQAMENTFKFNEDAAPAFIQNEEESYIPQFMRTVTEGNDKESKVPSGALYGTAMHRFMECFDFARDDYQSSFDEQLKYMEATKSLSDDEFARINHRKLQVFLNDDLSDRMSKAAMNGKLYKEKPFVFGSDAKELFDDEDVTDEMILVQGIIDVFFEEDDGIILMDYKTDKVDEDKDLVLRYEKQLKLYKDAIEHAYDVPVKEVLIYSFALERSINICTTN
ncbi:DNA helicase/exodeoxyribonuclease V, subunit A [Pseudobutyrivibrio sp. JW11]|uniref:helicase-exonuclease AddAB subunit AddA n=1 Tax=Pseudobutyrivibrio sp. JW11 TaxID=1855302 RepID=UPI0008E9CD05|nr:helicase-exonuclease AddAB subunit AddA [Pseudobutyrivibrio sp. JW11]SFO47292.1 DNA helicase/exodeoxyribonuclease V, subunit A [Pseudobutyrivibrio sp. JW11]